MKWTICIFSVTVSTVYDYNIQTNCRAMITVFNFSFSTGLDSWYLEFHLSISDPGWESFLMASKPHMCIRNYILCTLCGDNLCSVYLCISDDHSRVKIQRNDGSPGSDYINANFLAVSILLKNISWPLFNPLCYL